MAKKLDHGIHKGLSFAAYCDIDALNISTLLHFDGVTPMAGRHAMLHSKAETEALVRGHASHAAVLEPKVFESLYCKMPLPGPFRTKAAKEERFNWDSAHKDSIILDAKDYGVAVAVRDALMKSWASELFTGAGQNEVTILWADPQAGIECKARIDRLTDYYGQSIIDLKTARSLADFHLVKAITNYHYHIRMAWYTDALRAIHDGEFRQILVWCCTAAPFEVRATEFEEPQIEEGRCHYRALLEKFAQCREADEWPSYPAGIDVVALPKWTYRYTSPE